MKLHIIQRQLSIIFAGTILTLSSSVLPVFAAKTNEATLDSAGRKINTEVIQAETGNTLIAQRRVRRRYRIRCRTIRRTRRLWIRRCRRYFRRRPVGRPWTIRCRRPRPRFRWRCRRTY